ncbi:class I SAM-dependent methyltransferase [Bremerella cremea]|uniref:Class I SAM-dependent methyltransferase n=1 Tax=Bremerella cremea TaxID=1031537 RepID=A0A368KU56_9BACT|nr:class I SAM-dependent methyltransferase [Bremerella cremea]RCS53093.1 class I SAM-dependent methyltransferase [Bremerella cremea]
MDTWKFYDITHREHEICNPTSDAKLAQLVKLLRLPNNAQVADIACGKGLFLMRMAEAYEIRGTGIDISPFFIAAAQQRFQTQAPAADITFQQIDGADFKPDQHSLDLASCLGASWIFGGHANTLAALTSMVKLGGWVIVGEPFWKQEPTQEYLAACGCRREDFGSFSSNAEAGEKLGLELVHTFASNQDDWDTYEGLQWYATSEYARAHPDAPDLAEVPQRVNQGRTAYLRWGRDTLGWAIYLFRVRSAT